MTKEEESKEIHSLCVAIYSTDAGQKYLERMKKAFVDRPIYIAGLTSEEVAYREGQRNVIMQIMKELNND